VNAADVDPIFERSSLLVVVSHLFEDSFELFGVILGLAFDELEEPRGEVNDAYFFAMIVLKKLVDDFG
jgi:hypothetical protein